MVCRHGTIAVERLGIPSMLGTRRFSRAIADAAWGGFLATLRCKAESAGCGVVEVDPRGTSQGCSGCGAEVRKDLSVRRHDCPWCGLSLHRDENAARNILARGLQSQGYRIRSSPTGCDIPAKARTGPVGANGQLAVAREAVCFS